MIDTLHQRYVIINYNTRRINANLRSGILSAARDEIMLTQIYTYIYLEAICFVVAVKYGELYIMSIKWQLTHKTQTNIKYSLGHFKIMLKAL